MPRHKTKASTHPELTPFFFTLLPGLSFRKQVRVPDLLPRRQVPELDLSFRRQAPVWDQLLHRRVPVWDRLFRKRCLQPFHRTWCFPPFIDSIDILLSWQEESTGQI